MMWRTVLEKPTDKPRLLYLTHLLSINTTVLIRQTKTFELLISLSPSLESLRTTIYGVADNSVPSVPDLCL